MTYTCTRCGATRTARIPRLPGGALTDVDFTDPADEGKFDVENKPFVPKIVISPAVMNRLRTEDAQILAELQARFNTKLTFVSELHRHPESYSILDAESGQVLYSSGGPTTTM